MSKLNIKYVFGSVVSLVSLISCFDKPQSFPEVSISQINEVKGKSIHQFKTIKTLQDSLFDFSTLMGKKIMVVNTASKCGLTPQYKDLQALYNKYRHSNFEIIGFPCNDFLSQEPGDNKDIATFCTLNYGVTFPMMSKVHVKGENQDPIYSYLTKKSLNTISDSKVSWNFQKYLIGKNGFIEKIIPPKTNPLDTIITNWIEN